MKRFVWAVPLIFALSFTSPVMAGGYTLTTLATFNGTVGSGPIGGVALDGSGNLYGTTNGGGTNDDGTVFKIDAATGALSTLVSFDLKNGSRPRVGLTLDARGDVYGTTFLGGGSDHGTVFKIDAGSGVLSTITSFDSGGGTYPSGGVAFDGSGNLYGTTYDGGAYGDGTVFKIDAGTGSLSTLGSFDGGAGGLFPNGGVAINARGDIYGATQQGGAYGLGTVFKIDAVTGMLSTLVSFDGANGASPLNGVTLDAIGNIYGTTIGGGASGLGTVFKIDAATGRLSTLVSFDGANGGGPEDLLTVDAKGDIFGVAFSGGAYGDGTVFKIDAGTGSLSTLVSFDGENGASPAGRLALDAMGDIYGTTLLGGPEGKGGTVFRLSPNVTTVPEPGSILMFGLGVGLLVCAPRWKGTDTRRHALRIAETEN